MPRIATPAARLAPSRAGTLALALAVLATACATPRPSESPPAQAFSAEAPRPSGPSSAPRTATPTLGPASTPPATPSPTTAAGGAYLALGDSITFGIGVPQPQRNGYVARVADALADGVPPVTESRVFAVPGETATGFLERRLDDVVAAIEKLGPRVQLVTIGLGANELLRARRDPACQADPSGDACAAVVQRAGIAAVGALRTLVIAVQAALDANGAAPQIAVLAYYNPDARPVASPAVVGRDGIVSCMPADPTPGLDDRIACVAEERGLVLVDLHAAFLGREPELTRIRSGDVHPNAAGYQVIADEILDAIGG